MIPKVFLPADKLCKIEDLLLSETDTSKEVQLKRDNSQHFKSADLTFKKKGGVLHPVLTLCFRLRTPTPQLASTVTQLTQPTPWPPLRTHRIGLTAAFPPQPPHG